MKLNILFFLFLISHFSFGQKWPWIMNRDVFFNPDSSLVDGYYKIKSNDNVFGNFKFKLSANNSAIIGFEKGHKIFMIELDSLDKIVFSDYDYKFKNSQVSFYTIKNAIKDTASVIPLLNYDNGIEKNYIFWDEYGNYSGFKNIKDSTIISVRFFPDHSISYYESFSLKSKNYDKFKSKTFDSHGNISRIVNWLPVTKCSRDSFLYKKKLSNYLKDQKVKHGKDIMFNSQGFIEYIYVYNYGELTKVIFYYEKDKKWYKNIQTYENNLVKDAVVKRVFYKIKKKSKKPKLKVIYKFT